MLVVLSLATALVWIGTGAALASSIVIADVCHDPDNLIRNQTTDTTARGKGMIHVMHRYEHIMYI